MLTIYGVYRSRAARVYWMAEELGLDVTSVPVIQAKRLENPLDPDAPINTLSPDFLAVNPMGLIPSVQDSDLVLHESLAINLYLARKHGGPLAAQSVEEDGLMTMWTMWAATEVEQHSTRIVITYDNSHENTEIGIETIKVACLSLRRPLDVLERHLSTSGFIVGDRFTVADLNLAEVMRYCQTETELFDKRPNLSAWLARCQARPAFKAMWETRSNEPA